LYFLNSGLVSLIKMMSDGRTVEIGAIGIEGVTDPNAAFGVLDAALMEAVVQIPGTALRISRDALRDQLEKDAALRSVLQRYLQFFVQQIVQSAACNRLHSLEERCCRWLLVAHDSARSDTFPLTHEFLAMILGVQRASVSIAAKNLQRAGLIKYTRGNVTVTNRKELEESACECYAVLRRQLQVLFEHQRA
jgi:CRP-like cAMP-binding protein